MGHWLYTTAFLIGSVHASPVSIIRRESANGTESFETGWVSTPDGRGTSDLLISCLATMFLCAWTAYHPNVRLKSTFRKDFPRRVLWLIVAVFTPEIVLFFASEQWWAAKRLQKEVNKYVKAGRDSTPADSELGKVAKSDLASVPNIVITDQVLDLFRKENFEKGNVETWNLEQAFYATCGGIVVDSSSFWHQPVLTLTPAGIADLAACGLLPEVPERLIEDKSKADTFAKLYVCVQAGWFVIQSMARLIQHLPLTLLEIHTLAHIVCAFSMYFLWMQKPYNVEYPTYLTNQRAIDLVALFTIDNGELQGGKHTYRERMDLSQDDVIYAHTRKPKESILTRIWNWIDPSVPNVNPPAETATMKLHFQLANRAFTALQHCLDEVSRTSSATERPSQAYKPPTLGTKLVVPFRRNISTDTGHFSMRQIGIFIAFSAAYGAAHLGAWNSHFPSTVEMWMWRAAGLTIASTPTAVLLNQLFEISADAVGAWRDKRSKVQEKAKSWWVRFEYALVQTLAGTVYGILLATSWFWLTFTAMIVLFAAARLYIFVEVFISLRSTPAGTYQTVAWTGFIPHVG